MVYTAHIWAGNPSTCGEVFEERFLEVVRSEKAKEEEEGGSEDNDVDNLEGGGTVKGGQVGKEGAEKRGQTTRTMAKVEVAAADTECTRATPRKGKMSQKKNVFTQIRTFYGLIG